MPLQLSSVLFLALAASSSLLGVVTGDSEKLIFILAGQSNMAGRGGVSDDKWDGVVPPECQPNPSILRLSEKRQWEEAKEPLHADIDAEKINGIGPGMPFANAVRSSGVGGLLGLVPCAIGGTDISKWAPGTPLYSSMVQRASAAVAEGGGRIGALLWYQGESDTVAVEDAKNYGVRMEAMIQSLRTDLRLPELLVIQVALASGSGNFTEIVRESQKGIKLPNVLCVDAKGLALQDDNLHLTTESQVQLGKMLATAYLNFVSPTTRTNMVPNSASRGNSGWTGQSN